MNFLKVVLLAIALYLDFLWYIPWFYAEEKARLKPFLEKSKNPLQRDLLTSLAKVRRQIKLSFVLSGEQISELDTLIEYMQHRVVDGEDVANDWQKIRVKLVDAKLKKSVNLIDKKLGVFVH